MADALLGPALTQAGGPEPDDRADSDYAPPLAAGPGAGPRPDGLAWAWPGGVVTEAPAQRRDQPRPPGPELAGASPAGPATAGAATAGAGPDGDGLAGLPEMAELQRGRWSRVSWIFAAIWLIYLAQPMSRLWSDHNLVRRYLGLADLIAFAAVFILTFAAARFLRDYRNRRVSRRIGVAAVITQAALVALAYVTVGQGAGGLLIYVAVMAVFLLPTRIGWAAVAVCVAASLFVPWVHGWTVDGTMTFQILVSALAAWGVGQVIQRNGQLVAARNEITRLALADQRNRFARDLHDILGHSLTVVAVKAELAGRLASLDPQRAETEIADVERIARHALADVRAAAAGYREITLAGELASAHTALAAAGIEPDLLDQEICGIPRLQQELFGWAVREGVTNVVRHSGATRCRIRVSPGQVEICDDGCGPPALEDVPAVTCDPASGHGLAGLRERAADAGAVLSVGRSVSGGFALRVRMP